MRIALTRGKEKIHKVKNGIREMQRVELMHNEVEIGFKAGLPGTEAQAYTVTVPVHTELAADLSLRAS